MAFTSISASQTDADSPINQTLMDLIRTNLDDLNSRITATTGAGAAKGWIIFDGTGTVSILDSFNVSSLTDNGTGNYTVSWGTDFASASYCAVAVAANNVGGNPAWTKPNSFTVGSVDIYIQDFTTTPADFNRISVAAFGDQ